MSILSRIHQPEDVQALAPGDLSTLAGELREEVITTVARNGGHLASNLGVVELTIALLRVFSPPTDKILFDVSHQSYAYKLLTGRADRFHTLRQTDGLAGFQKRAESPCDAFGSGHAGNALSAALGLAVARDRAGRHENVIAVIGDAAFSNGISLEALNNVRETTGRLIIILNDNRMSIGRPTGALSRSFSRLLASRRYNRWKRLIESYGLRGVQRLRMAWLRDHYHLLESRIKSIFVRRRNTVFEELGIRYIGPYDGHNIDELERAFTTAAESELPVVVHVSTRKGRGYAPAETSPEEWHSTGPFDPQTGKRRPLPEGRVSWSDVFGGHLCALAETNPDIYALTAGMTDGTGLADFARRHPARFRDVGICEEHQLTFSAGLAAGGLRPVAAVYSTFLQRAVDSVLHDAALQGLGIVLALDRAGAVPGDGATHHGIFDIALLRPIPGIAICAPRTPADLRAMLELAIAEPARTTAIRYPRGSAPGAPAAVDPPVVFGRAAELSRTLPPDAQRPVVALWMLGPEDAYAAQLQALLLARGIGSIHVDARFAKPVDETLLRAQADEGVRIFFTWEDAILAGGFGEAVEDCLTNHPAHPSVVRFGWPDCFVQHATTRVDLLRRHHLTPEDALEAILRALP